MDDNQASSSEYIHQSTDHHDGTVNPGCGLSSSPMAEYRLSPESNKVSSNQGRRPSINQSPWHRRGWAMDGSNPVDTERPAQHCEALHPIVPFTPSSSVSSSSRVKLDFPPLLTRVELPLCRSSSPESTPSASNIASFDIRTPCPPTPLLPGLMSQLPTPPSPDQANPQLDSPRSLDLARTAVHSASSSPRFASPGEGSDLSFEAIHPPAASPSSPPMHVRGASPSSHFNPGVSEGLVAPSPNISGRTDSFPRREMSTRVQSAPAAGSASMESNLPPPGLKRRRRHSVPRTPQHSGRKRSRGENVSGDCDPQVFSSIIAHANNRLGSNTSDGGELGSVHPVTVPQAVESVTEAADRLHIRTPESASSGLREDLPTTAAVTHDIGHDQRERRVRFSASGHSRAASLNASRAPQWFPVPGMPRNRQEQLSHQNDTLIVAPRQPPISARTLRAIDAHQVLRQPSVRHEILFDPVTVRSPTWALQQAFRRSRSRARGADVSDEDVAAANRYSISGMYWDAIHTELVIGCRCTEFVVRHDGHPECALITRHKPAWGCQCGGWREDLSPAAWREHLASSPFPSRLYELIEQLRRIISDLMGSTIRPEVVPHTARESMFAEAERRQEAEEAHALVTRLLGALDPEHLVQRVRHGIPDLELLGMIADTMQHHCAPARDESINKIVKAAERGYYGLAFKRVFECAEAMQVDIVNHHLHQLRPVYTANATSLERSTLHALLGNTFFERSITRNWLRNASEKVIFNASSSERGHLMGRCACASRVELAVRSLAHGFVDFASAPWNTDPSLPLWPVMSDAAVDPECSLPQIPEALYYDGPRVSLCLARLTEISNFIMIVHAFRSKFDQENPRMSIRDRDAQTRAAFDDLARLQAEDKARSRPLDRDASSPADWAITLAWRMVAPPLVVGDVHQHPSEHMSAISRLSDEQRRRIDEIAIYLEAYRPAAEERERIRDALKKVVTLLLTNRFLAERHASLAPMFPRPEASNVRSCQASRQRAAGAGPSSPIPVSRSQAASQARERILAEARATREQEDQTIADNGFKVVSEQIRAIVKRMEPVIMLNISAFKDLYTAKGVLMGSGEATEEEMVAAQEERKAYDQNALVVTYRGEQ